MDYRAWSELLVVILQVALVDKMDLAVLYQLLIIIQVAVLVGWVMEQMVPIQTSLEEEKLLVMVGLVVWEDESPILLTVDLVVVLVLMMVVVVAVVIQVAMVVVGVQAS